MKPANWRRYYWYRPPPLTRPPMTPAELKEQAESYVGWLADDRQITRTEAEAYVESTRRRGGDAGPAVTILLRPEDFEADVD